MQDRYITRKKFVDRLLSFDDLAALAEMLQTWFLEAAGPGDHRTQVVVLIYPVADSERESLVSEILPASLPGSNTYLNIPGELKMTGPARAASDAPDLSLWHLALSNLAVSNFCIRLQISFEAEGGPLAGGRTEFILCGAAMPGSFLLKAMWPLQKHRAEARIYKAVAWEGEGKFLAAFDHFLSARHASQLPYATPPGAASLGATGRHLFMSGSHDRSANLLARQIVEFPQDRGLKRFLLRLLCLPVLALLALAILFSLVRHESPTDSPGCVVVFLLWLGGFLWIIFRKACSIHLRFKHFRANFRKLYSSPLVLHRVDLSSTNSPSRRKCSAELETVGAVHVCDYSGSVHAQHGDGARAYAWGTANVNFTIMEKTANLLFYPGKPVMMVTTRFAHGGKHFTSNGEGFRRLRDPQDSARFVYETDSVRELLALHEFEVDKLIAAGKAPLPPRATFEAIAEESAATHQKNAELWNKQPFTWTEAIYSAFQICRREFRPDKSFTAIRSSAPQTAPLLHPAPSSSSEPASLS